MQDWILAAMTEYGALGVFALILLENVFPPIPSEVILTFGGFMTTKAGLTPLTVILAATAGSLAGALILYGAGTLLDRPRLLRLTQKYGRYLGFEAADLERSLDTYEKYQKKTVFLCRMVPILRSLISVPAGMARMAALPFLLLTAAGSLIWNTVLVLAGAALGDAWALLLPYLDTYGNLVLAVGILLAVLLGMRRHARRQAVRRRAQAESADQKEQKKGAA